MNTEHHIDEYLRKEKGLKANPFLATRVMAQIESLQRSSDLATKPAFDASKANEQPALVYRLSTRLQTLAIAASFALVIAVGIGAGSLYNGSGQEATALNINDNSIENRSFLNILAYE